MTAGKFFLIGLIFLYSAIGCAQETRFDAGIGITSPYILDPSNGFGDTTINFGFDFRLYKALHLHQGINYAIAGVHALRYEVGPEVRLLDDKNIFPFTNFGPVFQFDPFTNTGMFFRIGLLGDVSRFFHIYFLKIKLESGLDFFLSNVERTEWEMFRISLVYGF